MGNAYQIECHQCGYSAQYYVGSARNDIGILTRSFAEIQHGASGRAARTFLGLHQQTYVTVERQLYECPACGRVQPRIAASLHSGSELFTQSYFCDACNSPLARISPEALTGRPCPDCGASLSTDTPIPFDIMPAVGETRPSPMQRGDGSSPPFNCLAPIPVSKGARELRYWVVSRDNMPIGVNDDGLPLFERYTDIAAARTDPDAYIVIRDETEENQTFVLLTCPLSEAGFSETDMGSLLTSLRTLAKQLGERLGGLLRPAFLHGGYDRYIPCDGDIDAPMLSTLWLHPLLDDHFELISLLLKLRQNDGRS